MTLMPRNPYDPFVEFDRLMDRMFDRMRALMNPALVPTLGDGEVDTLAAPMAVDMTSDDNAIVVRAALPGFKEDEIKVDVRGGVLTIAAETRSEKTDDKANWHLRELRYNRFYRAITLPEEVAGDKAEASLEDGILTIKLPKTHVNPVQRIAVKARNLLKGGEKKS
ncbi:MAG: Hsp20/alpha crystallin family protein [Candidatus Flexifilum sp.]